MVLVNDDKDDDKAEASAPVRGMKREKPAFPAREVKREKPGTPARGVKREKLSQRRFLHRAQSNHKAKAKAQSNPMPSRMASSWAAEFVSFT